MKINRSEFCNIMKVLREYADWERKMYDCDIDMGVTPVGAMAEHLQGVACQFNWNWSYDQKLEFDWLTEWIYTPDSPTLIQVRHGRTWTLTDAGVLYDFIEFMNEYGWEKE